MECIIYSSGIGVFVLISRIWARNGTEQRTVAKRIRENNRTAREQNNTARERVRDARESNDENRASISRSKQLISNAKQDNTRARAIIENYDRQIMNRSIEIGLISGFSGLLIGFVSGVITIYYME